MKFNIKEIAVKVGGVSAGAVVGKFANKLVPNMNPKIRGFAKIAIGAALPTLTPKSKIMDHVGSGIIAVGASELLAEFVPAIAGANENPMSGIYGEAVRIDEDYEEHDHGHVSSANENPMSGIAGELDERDM
jgi:hypothetical protein